MVDPKLSPTGDVIIYAAMGNGDTAAGGGIYRSLDTGKTWQRMKVGEATDVILDYNSVMLKAATCRFSTLGLKALACSPARIAGRSGTP